MAYTEEQLRTYRALSHAAEQVGRENYRSMGKRYHVTAEHRELIEAMPQVLSGELSINDAMWLVTSPAVMQQRFPNTKGIPCRKSG